MHVLWSQSDVSHDGKTSRRQPSDGLRHRAATLQLHSGSTAFLEEARCIPHGLLRRNLVLRSRCANSLTELTPSSAFGLFNELQRTVRDQKLLRVAPVLLRECHS